MSIKQALDYVRYFHFKGIKYKMLYNAGPDINAIDSEYECEYSKKITRYSDYKKTDFVIITIFHKFISNKYN